MTVSRAAAVSLAGLLTAGCTSFYEVGIETPIQPKLDVSSFQRVLVVGFIGGGTNDVDANMETVRLLRSQLRTRSDLRVIEAEVVPLADIVERTRAEAAPAVPAAPAAPTDPAAPAAPAAPADPAQTPADTKMISEQQLETYEQIFADVAYWKKLGEEYQSPLIITGTVYFAPINKSGIVERTSRETVDAFGRRQVGTFRQWMDRKGFTLVPKLVFIDGRTGTTLYSESVREEILYDASQNTPALSAYFELMDRYLPSFLSALSSQKIRGTRVLLK
jgi:hypothetical protein